MLFCLTFLLGLNKKIPRSKFYTFIDIIRYKIFLIKSANVSEDVVGNYYII